MLYTLRDVLRREAGRTILELPELDIPEGRVTALVGPNGAGKSTLLRVLACLDRPERGDLQLRGRRVSWLASELVALRREITLVEQTPYLFRGSVFHNVAFGLALRKVPRPEWPERVGGALTRVDLVGGERLSVHGLSGGETRRVAIARALAVAPRVLLLDEPFASVDRRRIELLESLIHELVRERGTSVVLSTHDLAQAHALAEQVICLENGRMAPESHANLFSGEIQHAGGLSFLALRSGRLVLSGSPSGRVTCTVSPSAIQLHAGGDRVEADNRFTGRVVRVVLHGKRARLRVEAGEVFRVELPVASAQRSGLTVGVDVELTFPAAAVRLLE